jgi:hypothetical protein
MPAGASPTPPAPSVRAEVARAARRRAKTGNATVAGERVSWVVGHVESGIAAGCSRRACAAAPRAGPGGADLALRRSTPTRSRRLTASQTANRGAPLRLARHFWRRHETQGSSCGVRWFLSCCSGWRRGAAPAGRRPRPVTRVVLAGPTSGSAMTGRRATRRWASSSSASRGEWKVVEFGASSLAALQNRVLKAALVGPAKPAHDGYCRWMMPRRSATGITAARSLDAPLREDVLHVHLRGLLADAERHRRSPCCASLRQ